MLRSRKPEIAAFRADYSMRADFCAVFEEDMKPLYLLAFLLTANHKEAEQCFASTVEEAQGRPRLLITEHLLFKPNGKFATMLSADSRA